MMYLYYTMKNKSGQLSSFLFVKKEVNYDLWQEFYGTSLLYHMKGEVANASTK